MKNTAGQVITTPNLTKSRLFLSLYPICPISLSLCRSPTTQTDFFFAYPPLYPPPPHRYYLTEAWHNQDSKLWADSKACKPISISYNKLAAFDTVFSSHQQFTNWSDLPHNPQSRCGLTGHWPDSAPTWSHLQCATIPTQSSVSSQDSAEKTIFELSLDWRVVPALIMSRAIKINSSQSGRNRRHQRIQRGLHWLTTSAIISDGRHINMYSLSRLKNGAPLNMNQN